MSGPGGGDPATDDVHPICVTCGVQYDPLLVVDGRCVVCEDERQYVGWDGQRWTTLAELAEQGHQTVLRQEGALWGVGTEPSFAIGQRALLVPGEGGNLLWDCVSYLDAETVAAVAEQGGIAAVAVSHPHFYSSAIAWSEAFGGVPVYLHAADAEWVCRDGNIVSWTGDTLEVLPGRTLLRAGVHFAGGTVLHWDGADAGGVTLAEPALCTGDILTVVMDRRYVSFMYSYPNHVPESPAVIDRALRLLEPWPFDTIYGGWWRRVVTGDAKQAVQRSAERYLARLEHEPD
ncbi:MBL fold metallo-hydrolase [Rhodococcus sp. X156]|uniref:MBL fold metallo-hydrolase n=1 Tax=Rhodococcus sp. X156 TaxID=2499145 RepID=UPI000FDCB55E|nr:MBL fold metallo-hydrolase [Rhodococcus sp. X156]